MPLIYEVIDETFFWLAVLAAIPTGLGIHELVRCHFFPDDDDDADGYT